MQNCQRNYFYRGRVQLQWYYRTEQHPAGRGQDSCQGDAGGPIIRPGVSATNDEVVGIVSFRVGCAEPSFPGIYSRISSAYEWIDSTVCELSSFGCLPNYLRPPPPTEAPTKVPTYSPTGRPTVDQKNIRLVNRRSHRQTVQRLHRHLDLLCLSHLRLNQAEIQTRFHQAHQTAMGVICLHASQILVLRHHVLQVFSHLSSRQAEVSPLSRICHPSRRVRPQFAYLRQHLRSKYQWNHRPCR